MQKTLLMMAKLSWQQLRHNWKAANSNWKRLTKPGKGGEIQLTDALRVMAHQESVYAYNFDGKRYDTGDKLGYLKATVEFALRRNDLGPAFREYLKELAGKME